MQIGAVQQQNQEGVHQEEQQPQWGQQEQPYSEEWPYSQESLNAMNRDANIVCDFCHKKGHRWRDCWARKGKGGGKMGGKDKGGGKGYQGTKGSGKANYIPYPSKGKDKGKGPCFRCK